MNKVLLGHLDQKVGVKLDIELKMPGCLLGSSDVKVESSVQVLYGEVGIATLAPFNKRFKVNKVSCLLCLASVVCLVDFIDKLQLLLGIVILILFHSAIDHPN